MFDDLTLQNASCEDIALANKMFNPTTKSEKVLRGIK